jgi:hypothetical protein
MGAKQSKAKEVKERRQVKWGQVGGKEGSKEGRLVGLGQKRKRN